MSEIIDMAIHEGGQPHSSSTYACDPTDFNLFLQSRIWDLGMLRAHMGRANFVAMDTEHGAGVSSIGLAFSPKLRPVRYLNHPEVLTGNREGAPWYNAPVWSMCFNIRGFERWKPSPERVWGQPDEDIDIQDAASKVVEAVELSAISALVPQLYRLFSGWVDLQPIITDTYHSHTNYTRLDGLRPSLRCAMRSLGFLAGFQPPRLHHAGNDALRTMAIMACLTHKNVRFDRMKRMEYILKWRQHQSQQWPLKGTEESRSLPGNKPEVRGCHSAAGPAEQQEYAGQVPLPSLYSLNAPRAWFSWPYVQSAIGRDCIRKAEFGCLPSSETLQHLIKELGKR